MSFTLATMRAMAIDPQKHSLPLDADASERDQRYGALRLQLTHGRSGDGAAHAEALATVIRCGYVRYDDVMRWISEFKSEIDMDMKKW